MKNDLNFKQKRAQILIQFWKFPHNNLKNIQEISQWLLRLSLNFVHWIFPKNSTQAHNNKNVEVEQINHPQKNSYQRKKYCFQWTPFEHSINFELYPENKIKYWKNFIFFGSTRKFCTTEFKNRSFYCFCHTTQEISIDMLLF